MTLHPSFPAPPPRGATCGSRAAPGPARGGLGPLATTNQAVRYGFDASVHVGVLVVNNDLRVGALVTARRFATGRRRTRTTACNPVGSSLGGGDHGPGGGGGAGEPPAVGVSGEQLQNVEGGVVYGDVVAERAAVDLAGGGAPAEPEQQGPDVLGPLLGGVSAAATARDSPRLVGRTRCVPEAAGTRRGATGPAAARWRSAPAGRGAH